MIKSRRSRTLVLTLWSLFVVGLFFAYQSHQQGKAAKAFLDNVEESTRLESTVNTPPKVNKDQDLTTEKGATFSPEKEYKAILLEAPIVVFSKTYCPFSKKAKEVLSKYQITPDPLIVEIDQHPHGAELQAYIGEVTGRKTVPNVHVKGLSRGGGDDFAAFHEQGVLIEKIQQWAANSVRIKKIPVPAGQAAGGSGGAAVGGSGVDHHIKGNIKAVGGAQALVKPATTSSIGQIATKTSVAATTSTNGKTVISTSSPLASGSTTSVSTRKLIA